MVTVAGVARVAAAGVVTQALGTAARAERRVAGDLVVTPVRAMLVMEAAR